MTNYTVVVSSPVRFGVPEREGFPRENFDDIPFGGVEANIPFRCVNAAQDQPAVLLIYHTGRTSPAILMVNGREIPDGLPSTNRESTRVVRDPDGPDRRVTDSQSKGRILTQFILPPGVVRNDNVLRIFGQPNLELQPFWLYNAVVFFKFSTSVGGPRDDLVLNPEIRR